MVIDSPLYLTKVECPICGTINEFETIRVGAYNEGERETDFCPSYIKWRNPKYQKYHPLLFFTAVCSQCFYTREFNTRLREWKKDNNFRTYRLKNIKEKHLINLAASDSFLRVVGELIDIDEYPDESAILKLVLAVYDEHLNDHASHLDLGRFYLRIAWLFRHCGGRVGRQSEEAIVNPLADVERAVRDLSTWAAGFGRNLEYFDSAVTQYREITRQSQADAADDGFTQAGERWHQMREDCDKLISEVESHIAGLKSMTDPVGSSAFDGTFHDYGSFEECLNKLNRMWDGVPRTELEALRYAVKFYISAYEAGKEIAPGNQTIQATYLIAELSRRTGDHDTARQYFNTTIRAGQQFINEIKGDRTRTALAKKILELAMAQGKRNLAEAK